MSDPKLRPRDAGHVGFVGTYGTVTFAEISAVRFGRKSVGQIMKKLDEEFGLLRVRRKAIGKLSLVSLRPKGARLVGLPVERCNLTGSAIDLALGIGFACIFGKHRRHRVEVKDLKKVFGGAQSSGALPAANVAHIVTGEDGEPAILRVYQCQTGVEKGIQQLRAQFEKAVANETLRAAVHSRQYGFACLGTNPQKVEALHAAAKRADLHQDGLFKFFLGPDQSTIQEALKRWRRSS